MDRSLQLAEEYIILSSNNYLGLATDSRLQEAIGAIHKYGVGAGAVRTINGTLDLHIKLEETIKSLNIQKQKNCLSIRI